MMGQMIQLSFSGFDLLGHFMRFNSRDDQLCVRVLHHPQAIFGSFCLHRICGANYPLTQGGRAFSCMGFPFPYLCRSLAQLGGVFAQISGIFTQMRGIFPCGSGIFASQNSRFIVNDSAFPASIHPCAGLKSPVDPIRRDRERDHCHFRSLPPLIT